MTIEKEKYKQKKKTEVRQYESDVTSVEAMAREIADRDEEVTLLVNNAGACCTICHSKTPTDDDDEWVDARARDFIFYDFLRMCFSRSTTAYTRKVKLFITNTCITYVLICAIAAPE